MAEPKDDEAIAAFYKALAHRTRRHILLAMQGETLAPVDYELRFGSGNKKELSHVSYHFEALEEAGLIELVKTEPIRGSVKHWYQLSPGFAPEVREALALDRIAELLNMEAANVTKGLAKEIVDIVVATGRRIREESF